MTYLTQADIFRPTLKRNALLYNAALVICGSMLIAAAAQPAVRLPFSPIPVTGQTLAVLLVGALLGSKRGSLAVLAYLAEGAAGLPVFAGGTGGAIVLLGPTGGYLPGFVLAAGLVGWLAERGWDRNVFATVLAMLAGNIAIYVPGLLWLATFAGMEQAVALGLAPFIVGDIAKLVLAALLLPLAWKAHNAQ